LTTFGFSLQILIKVSAIKFHANPFIGSRVDAYVRTFRPTDWQADRHTT